MKIVNIILHYRPPDSRYISTQRFSDWYDLADWLKQEEQLKRENTIVRWVYDVAHI